MEVLKGGVRPIPLYKAKMKLWDRRYNLKYEILCVASTKDLFGDINYFVKVVDVEGCVYYRCLNEEHLNIGCKIAK